MLCVSVHQADAGSSDLVLDVELLGLKAREFAALNEREKGQMQAVNEAKKAAAKPAQIPALRVRQPQSLVTIFDSRIKPEQTRLVHMLQSLPRIIGISEDQVEELILAADDSFKRLRTKIEERANTANQTELNRLRNEIYQNKISLTTDEGLIETFAAILTPTQLNAYSKFAKAREEERLASTIAMFYANLNSGLFFSDEQRPKMLDLLRSIAQDPKTARSYATNSNPISEYYRIQNGFTRAVRGNDQRIKGILSAQQLATLNAGITTGTIYGGKFINVDRVLAPEEK